MQDFDPNNPTKGKKQPTWATFIPDRTSGQFKIHYGRGPALNACNGVKNFILYSWNDLRNKWDEVSRVEDRPSAYRDRDKLECESCHRNRDQIRQENSNYIGSFTYEWVGKPKLRQVIVCGECRRQIGASYSGGRPIDERHL